MIAWVETERRYSLSWTQSNRHMWPHKPGVLHNAPSMALLDFPPSLHLSLAVNHAARREKAI